MPYTQKDIAAYPMQDLDELLIQLTAATLHAPIMSGTATPA